jgi:hypothetical protein
MYLIGSRQVGQIFEHARKAAARVAAVAQVLKLVHGPVEMSALMAVYSIARGSHSEVLKGPVDDAVCLPIASASISITVVPIAVAVWRVVAISTVVAIVVSTPAFFPAVVTPVTTTVVAAPVTIVGKHWDYHRGSQ